MIAWIKQYFWGIAFGLSLQNKLLRSTLKRNEVLFRRCGCDECIQSADDVKQSLQWGEPKAKP